MVQLVQLAITDNKLRLPIIPLILTMPRNRRCWAPDVLLELEEVLYKESDPLHVKLVEHIIGIARLFTKDRLFDIVRRALHYDSLHAQALKTATTIMLPEARSECEKALFDKSSVIVRVALEQIILNWPNHISENLEKIKKNARSRNRAVRSAVCRALSLVSKEEAEPTLLELLADTEQSVRREALIAIKQLKEDDAIPHILLALQDPSILVRVEACQSLVYHDQPEVLEALLVRLKDSSRKVRMEAFKTIASIDKNLALRHLKPLLELESIEFRFLERYLFDLGLSKNEYREVLESSRETMESIIDHIDIPDDIPF